ncbi:laccase [Eremomyces bilateralis CBS 781.70]|uniref:laccase n=1 Tax=Eremomyces bilateralis CBS 781.70 TaxID=1392243 RepID=A0A6G1FRV1_9PEZI|nr:laccase [Eremomyces bilateralis CBS 781.70]KAF1808399.1 laccase [Eremomyces bilateralis CBS 781.70]
MLLHRLLHPMRICQSLDSRTENIGRDAERGSTQWPPSAAPTTTSRAPDSPCKNGPLTRSCWSNGFSIATDFDEKWPNTGKTVYYTLELRNTTCNPDGNGNRTCLLFNDQLPGPTIIADWGDTIAVTVKNFLPDNGTSIHWHGVRMLDTVTEDGVNGITECPLAPGDTKVYTFRATQFGTTWYHSHHSAQYGDGAVGTLIINGPAAANYDIDLGTYSVTDWYYPTAFQINAISHQNLQVQAPPPPGDTILINGTNKHPTSDGGSYSKVKLTPGKKYRLRLVNTSVDNNIRVSLDGHKMKIITGDFIPVQPIDREWILLGIGQRYDIVIQANQPVGNYWFRAIAAAPCASGNRFSALSIFQYDGAPNADPTTTGFTVPTTCADEAPLVPWVKNNVPSESFISQAQNLDVDLGRQQVTTNGESIVVWAVNMTAIDIQWEKPTLQYLIDGNTNYPQVSNLIEIPAGQQWTYWIIQETGGTGTRVPIPHPMHLHGHDFYILGSGRGTFDKNVNVADLKFNNPDRRDVTFLPGGGWVVVAFPTDNPGAWLMHCHVAWHIGEGLGVQFLERKSEITLPGPAWQQTCTNWKRYYSGNPAWLKEDSGL